MRIVVTPSYVKDTARRAVWRTESSQFAAIKAQLFAVLGFQFDEVGHVTLSSGMRWRVVALISLAANVALLVAWLKGPRAAHNSVLQTVAQAAPESVQTNLVVRRQLFSWRDVESTDYPTYIANLRFIGCPEQTIRDIIIADVNSTFARRRATELTTPEQQWWRSEPDDQVRRAAEEKTEALEVQRRNLLSSLLGPNWEGGDMASLPRPSRPGVVLDGPVLGNLSAEAQQALQEINARSEDRMQEYLEEQTRRGVRPDPAEMVKLRQQTRDELAKVLAAPELEEYLLRYSQTASELRNEFGELRFFNASPDEFRAVFRATDALDQRIASISGTDAHSVAARKSLEAQREEALRLTLGEERYEQFRRLQDPLYREAMGTAIASGNPDSAELIYMGNLAAEQERTAITNANYTASQRALAQKQMELEQLTANTLASGQRLVPELPPMPPTPRRTYTVRAGDTPGVISLIYGIPVNALRQSNPNVNLQRLRPGDVLVVPPAILPPMGAP